MTLATLKTLLHWGLVAFVIVGTALTGVTGTIPDPWDRVVTNLIGLLYAWGLVRRPPAPAATPAQGGGGT